MKRKRQIWILVLLIAVICGCLMIPVYNYYTPASERAVYTCEQPQDDTLRIAMIGDSWVFLHYPYNDTLKNLISQKTGRPVKVSAYGLCGKTSKEVYHSFFNDQTMQALLKQGADYCFISVGINDTYKKIGADYYAQSTSYILRFLIQNNIKAILLEIPDYDIYYAYEHQSTEKKFLRQLSMLVTGSKLDCREDYRQALMRQMQETGIEKQITIFQFPYSMEYYQPDRMHLNNKGYQLLDSCIASVLMASYEGYWQYNYQL